jgi:large subunit ribosomal protein L15
MAIYLHNISPTKGSQKDRKRVGRGGKRGTYSGRGLKGQKSRSGVSGLKRRGMKQLIERSHKLRGFKSIHAKPEIISLADLDKNFKASDKVTPQILVKKKLVDTARNGVKILSNGKIKSKITVSGCSISATAKTAIESAGGKVIELKKKTTDKSDKKAKEDNKKTKK